MTLLLDHNTQTNKKVKHPDGVVEKNLKLRESAGQRTAVITISYQIDDEVFSMVFILAQCQWGVVLFSPGYKGQFSMKGIIQLFCLPLQQVSPQLF